MIGFNIRTAHQLAPGHSCWCWFCRLGEFNRMVDGLVGDFFDKGNIATSILLVGTICMAVVSVLSSISRTK